MPTTVDLNGLGLDFVLLNPKVGIRVEVKNWNLDAMNYWVKQTLERTPLFLAQEIGRVFGLESMDPVTKIQRYKDELVNSSAYQMTPTGGCLWPPAYSIHAR